MVSPLEPGYPPIPFKDRKAGLIIFGILTALMGCVFALMVPFMYWAQTMAASAGTLQSKEAMAPAMAMYGVYAVALIWLGIGSMMARRWARALLLIFSWTWLIVGVISVVVMAFLQPAIMASARAAAPPGQPPMPASADAVVLIVMMTFMVVIFVILPAIWLLFYRSPHVKATCEALDPVERWTDRCPLPVLAISLWLAFCAPMMLMMPVMYKGVIPFFGMFLTGPAGSALYVLLALLWGYSAWAIYKLRGGGWWIVVVSFTVFCISGFVTYSRHDIFELYTLMGYSPQMIAQIKALGMFNGPIMAWGSLIGLLPFLGYLFWVRKYFRPATEVG